jgi:hypothetical protein
VIRLRKEEKREEKRDLMQFATIMTFPTSISLCEEKSIIYNLPELVYSHPIQVNNGSMLNKQLLILAQKYNLAPASHTILPGYIQTFFDNNKPL